MIPLSLLGRSSIALALSIFVLGGGAAIAVLFVADRSVLPHLPFLTETRHREQAPGAVDIGFAQSMLLHHNQAIHMAMQMRDSNNQSIRGLADSIVLAQLHESGMMRGWLSAWGAPPVVAGPPMAWVEQATNVWHLDDQLYAAQCKAAGGDMAGLATPQELAELENRVGVDQQRFFLQLMIAHHQAAIPMANFAFRNGSSSLVKGFSRTMAKEQMGEIVLMQQLLAELDSHENN